MTEKKAAKKRPARSALIIISACFLGSAVLRVANPESAFAVELPKMAEASSEVAPPEVEKPKSKAELSRMLSAMAERDAQLEARANQLAEKEKLMEAAEQKLRDQMVEMKEAEARLEGLLRMADQAADKDITRLVTAFQSMDAKRAGPIFENMDVAFAAGLVSRMNENSAAEILGILTPERAYAITVYIAGQNARAPKN